LADGAQIRRLIDLDDPPDEPLAGHAGEDGRQHVFVRQTANGLGQRGAKGRAHRHHHLGLRAGLGRAQLAQARQRRAHIVGNKVARRFHLRHLLHLKPALGAHTVAGAGAGVVVDVVNGA